MAISFIRSGKVDSGISFTMDIGTADTNRLICIAAAYEGSQMTLSGVTVDGKPASILGDAFNNEGLGNNLELWCIMESDLGSSNGVVTIAIQGGSTSWGVAGSLYTGVKQQPHYDVGVDSTTINSTTTTVTGIDSPDNGLVVATVSHGDIPTTTDFSSYSIPVTLRETDFPTSAEMYLLDGIEATQQTNKSYTCTVDENVNRFSHVVATFEEAVAVLSEQTHQMII